MTTAPTPLHRRRTPRITASAFAAAVLVVLAVAFLVRHDVSQNPPTSKPTVGSGVAAVQPRHLSPFDGVELAGSNTVAVHVGGRQKVVVHADDNLLRLVTTRLRAGSLVIGNTGSFTTKAPMRVEVTVPSLDTLVLAGSGNVTADGVRAQHLRATLSGSGTLRAGGTATRLDVSLMGSGEVQLERLIARDVRAVLAASGRIVVHATGRLDASVPGSGAIVYFGSPAHLTKSVTGSGTVMHG